MRYKDMKMRWKIAMWMGALAVVMGVLGFILYKNTRLVQDRHELYSQLSNANCLFAEMQLALLDYTTMFGNVESMKKAVSLIESTRLANVTPFTELGGGGSATGAIQEDE